MLIRRTLVLVVALLGLGALAGCGGDDPADAPIDASQSDFCDAYGAFYDLDSAGSEKIRKLQDALLEVGMPSGVSSEVREGFEVVTDPEREFADVDEFNDLDDASPDGEAADGLKKYYEDEC